MSFVVNRANHSINYTLPAPCGGLNAKDSLSQMSPQDAIVMDNYIPLDTKVSLRKGYSVYHKSEHAFFTLASYKKSNAPRLIGVSNGQAWNLTSKSNITPYSGVSFTDNHCQTLQYKDRLWFMNGADTPKVFYVDENNQDVFTDWNFSADNLTASKIVAGGVSKQFVWFVEKGSMNVWYSTEAGNIQGELYSFDLSQVARFGGKIQAVCNWTLDGGAGIDDLTVFITSEGEVMVYSGSNPNSADDWTLKGSYKIARPIGWNCVLQYQGDVVVITEEGYLPLSKVLSLNQAGASAQAFSDKIRGLILQRAAANHTKDGWQGIIYPRGGYCLFNVPVGRIFEQHVINTSTGAWCRFTGINSNCWSLFEGRLYFGGKYGVCLFDDGYSDAGAHIKGEVRQAFNNLGYDGLKKIHLLNPRTKSSVRYYLVIYADMDFADTQAAYVENLGNAGLTKWNETAWSCLANPIGSKWQTLKGSIRSQWIACSATGIKAGLVFKTKTRGNLIEWFETGIRYEQATGIL